MRENVEHTVTSEWPPILRETISGNLDFWRDYRYSRVCKESRHRIKREAWDSLTCTFGKSPTPNRPDLRVSVHTYWTILRHPTHYARCMMFQFTRFFPYVLNPCPRRCEPHALRPQQVLQASVDTVTRRKKISRKSALPVFLSL